MEGQSGSRIPSLKGRKQLPDALTGGLLFLLVLSLSFVFVTKMGLLFYLTALGGLSAILILGYISLREVSLAVVAWLFIMSGFRYVGMVNMPGLPDLSLDRILLIWIIVMFFLRTVIQGEKIYGPFIPEIILLTHTVYILVQMQFQGSESHFHTWVLSMLTPFVGFLYGKHAIRKDSELRNLFLFFLILSIYFFVISIAEKFKIDPLIWPKTILNSDKGLIHRGRSRGPVLHAPMFGELIAMLTMVYFLFLARVKNYIGKVLVFLGLGLSLLGSFFTYTRGPWVSLIVGIVFIVTIGREYRRYVGALIIVAILGGILGVAQLADSEFFEERMNNTNTIENRMGFLANTFRVIQDYPLFGVGYFQWMEHLGEYNQTSYIPFYGIVRRNVSGHVPIHDIYFGRFAEEGLLGSFLQFSFYFVILQAFRRKMRAGVWSPWFNENTLVVFGAILVTYLVGGMIIDYRYFDLINVIFYLVAGIVYGYDPAANQISMQNNSLSATNQNNSS